MESAANRRSHQRIVVGPDVTIRFQVKEFAFQDVRITNLSADGCFATLPHSEHHLFQQGTLLEQFRFETPDLDGGPIIGRVAYVLGLGPGEMAIIGLGIHFTALTPAMAKALLQYVGARVLEHPAP